tara:strand:- start:747 stop:1292 length:546 start_codon:yes stop_codon:yes gene_type:complete
VGLSSNGNLQVTNSLSNLFFKNLFIINKEEIEKIISKYNIIEEYNIKKIYPSRLNINIKPTKFIAKINDNSQFLVGANGKIIIEKKNDKKLPSIFGKFDSSKFLKFKKSVDNSKFDFNKFKSIFFYSSNRWDILTIDEITIKLPEKDLLNSLNLAYDIIKNNQFIDNEVVDLRVSGHIIIK